MTTNYLEREENLLIPHGREISYSVLAFSFLCILIDLVVLYRMYHKRSLRNSCTAIIVCNLACVDILVTLKDIPSFLEVIDTGSWRFVDNWCQSNGLTSVIYIIVSVSTLATVASERFSRLRLLGVAVNEKVNPYVNLPQNTFILGFVIAHTTLSYSLSLMWSKYVFLTRKVACRAEWPQHGSLTFLASFVFVVPVSALVYNALVKNIVESDSEELPTSLLQNTKDSIYNRFEEKAQHQIHVAITIFLFTWTPYVIESLVSSYTFLHPNICLAIAFIPLASTSMLPLFYSSYAYPKQSDSESLCI